MASTTKNRIGGTDFPAERNPALPGAASKPPQSAGAVHFRPSATRETIESIVVAFVLAFLFKTFEAEAFVIPTGSMAPTLLGRHKDVVCPECGFHFRIGASDEVESETELLIPDNRIRAAVCPNCRYLIDEKIYGLPVFKGDRILVNKFPYELGRPSRWDVTVFKYPEEPKTNYIKRCVGLPNDTLEIRQGDVYKITEKGPEILRKDDPNKQRVLQLAVYDDDHPEQRLIDAGWPERWAAVKKGDAPDAIAGWSPDADGWSADAKLRSYHLTPDRAGSDFRWLRYRNYVPDSEAWSAASAGRKPVTPRPQLISDFCGYNAYSNFRGMMADDLGVYWVGDLTLNCTIHVQTAQPGAQVMLELNEGARAYRCRIDLANGKATLSHAEPRGEAPGVGPDAAEEHALGTADTRFLGTGSHNVSFANVDDRLCLWIDNRLIDFGSAASYTPYGGLPIQRPWDDDLIPVGVAARGADVTVSHLVVQRDLYYRADISHSVGNDHDGMRPLEQIEEYDGSKHLLVQRLANPGEYFLEYDRGLSAKKTGPGEKYEGVDFQFPLGDDEYLMLGDNSPRSKDSRLWSNSRRAEHRYAVPGVALVGKAFFVYWPHGVPFMNNGRGYPDNGNSIWNNRLTASLFYHQERNPHHPDGPPVLPDPNNPDEWYPKPRVPFYPNVERMHRIR